MIGLVPAGGKATRISPLPCSKEIYPVGMRAVEGGNSMRPKVAGHYLLEKMRLAGAGQAYIVIGPGKWDIPAYFGDGSMIDMRLAYLVMNHPFGVPYTVDQAYPFIKNQTVMFGFPDILFQPVDAYQKLLAKQESKQADAVLGLFSALNPSKMDMVALDINGNPRGIDIKPTDTSLQYTWIIAVWSPIFTEFMHAFVLSDLQMRTDDKGNLRENACQEVYVGDVIRAAIDYDLKIDTIIFSGGDYVDIGTPEDIGNVNRIERIIMETTYDNC